MIARSGRFVKADDLNRHRRTGVADLLSLVVRHRPHAADRRPGDQKIADVQRSVLDQQRGDCAARLVQPRLNDRARRSPVRVRFELLHIRDEQNHFQQLRQPVARGGGHLADDGLAAPFFRKEVMLRQLAQNLIGVGARLIHLVDRDDNRHVGGLGVVNRLNGLRHDAVVRRDDQNRHVGDGGAARAHRGESRVSRRIEEGDDPFIGLDLISADVLCDAARLARDDVRFADGVQQRGLAVVDVTHHDDDRVARL